MKNTYNMYHSKYYIYTLYAFTYHASLVDITVIYSQLLKAYFYLYVHIYIYIYIFTHIIHSMYRLELIIQILLFSQFFTIGCTFIHANIELFTTNRLYKT